MAKYLGTLVTYYYTKFVIVITLALGLQPRQGFAKVQVKSELGSHISWSQESKRVWRNEPPYSQMSSHFGGWSPNELLNV
jgi:hypothetical protein